MKTLGYLVVGCLLALISISGAQAGQLARIFINPGYVTLCPGTSQQFTLYGTDSDDNVVPINGVVTWSANATAGSIISDGLFTSGATTGVYADAVTATVGSLKATAIVQVVPATVQGGKFILERSWGEFTPGQLISPKCITVDSSDNVYVQDASGRMVQKFDSNGQFISIVDLKNKNNIHEPIFLEMSPDNGIYLMDQWRYVYRLDQTGNILKTWAGPSFYSPCGFASDSNGYTYVIGDYVIGKYDANGNRVLQWGSFGSGDNQFLWPMGLAVDAQGYIYVADSSGSSMGWQNVCIKKFDSNGNFIARWSKDGVGRPETAWKLYCLTVGRDGNVYLAGSSPSSNTDSCIRKFDSSGHLISTITPNVEFDLNHIAVDSTGCIYGTADGVVKLDPQGRYLCRWGKVQDGGLFSPGCFDCSTDGRLIVTGINTPYGTGFKGLKTFDQSGHLKAWDKSIDPVSVTCTADGSTYAVCKDRTMKYDSSGNAVFQWNEGGSGVAVTPTGDIFIVSSGKVSNYSSTGNLITRWTFPTTSVTWPLPMSIALGPDGSLYVVDNSNDKILVFDSHGQLLRSWGSGGGEQNQMVRASSIAITSDGLVIVGEYGNDRVHIFDQQGRHINMWGDYGPAYTEFGGPFISLDDEGSLYVADNLNNRIMKFLRVDISANLVKSKRDGVTVALSGMISTASTAEMGDGFYAEPADRSNGIRITKKSIDRGRSVLAIGKLATVDGERELQATYVSSITATVPQPLALTNKSLGGGDFNFNLGTGSGQRGVEDGVGLNNIGLLVKTTGKVTVVGDEFFYIDDGTHAKDASIFNGVRVKCGKMTKPTVGTQVSVTGISSITKIGDRYFRSIRPRASTDIVSL